MSYRITCEEAGKESLLEDEGSYKFFFVNLGQVVKVIWAFLFIIRSLFLKLFLRKGNYLPWRVALKNRGF